MAQLVVSAEDRALLLPSVVARRLGVSYGKVMEWARRSEIDPSLQREAERTMPGALR